MKVLFLFLTFTHTSILTLGTYGSSTIFTIRVRLMCSLALREIADPMLHAGTGSSLEALVLKLG